MKSNLVSDQISSVSYNVPKLPSKIRPDIVVTRIGHKPNLKSPESYEKYNSLNLEPSGVLEKNNCFNINTLMPKSVKTSMKLEVFLDYKTSNKRDYEIEENHLNSDLLISELDFYKKQYVSQRSSNIVNINKMENSYLPDVIYDKSVQNKKVIVNDKIRCEEKISRKNLITVTKNLNSAYVSSDAVSNKNLDLEKKEVVVGNSKMFENSTTICMIKNHQESKKAIENPNLQINKRYFNGIRYLTGIIKEVLIYKEPSTYQEITEEVCNHVLVQKAKYIDGLYKNKNKELKNLSKRIYDALHILIGACILEKRQKKLYLANNKLCKEVLEQKALEQKVQFDIVKYKRIELIAKIRKYSIIKGLIKRNQACPSTDRKNLPFVIVKKGSKESGHQKLDKSHNGKKACIKAEVKLQIIGDLKAISTMKLFNMIDIKVYNAHIKECIDKIKQRDGQIPFYLITTSQS